MTFTPSSWCLCPECCEHRKLDAKFAAEKAGAEMRAPATDKGGLGCAIEAGGIYVEIDGNLVNIANMKPGETLPLYGKSPMTDMQAGLAAFNDERRKRQAAEGQRDMIREQRDNALADKQKLTAANLALDKLNESQANSIRELSDMVKLRTYQIDAMTKAPMPQPPSPHVGSIVTLKSGGPRMTVAEDQDGKASCLWWAGQFFVTGLFEYAGLATLPN